MGSIHFQKKKTQNTACGLCLLCHTTFHLAYMHESNFMMALLTPSPSSPGKDFDVFLEPLVEDLLNLWTGVSAYDANTGKMFKLCAAVLWCIHDYPALSTPSGRTTKGYYACTHCGKHPLSYRLRSKIGYFGHYRFLPKGHRLRRNNEYVGLHQSNDPPGQFSTEELLAELEKVKDVRPGKQKPEEGSGKRKRSNLGAGHVKIWSRKAKFEIDTDDPVVKKACLNMMKDAVRQQRHRLKKECFDPFPLHLVSRTSPIKSMDDKQWIALVESWKSPKKMHECEMNKDNRSKVQFPQATGSQSYEVFIETKIGDKYKDEEPIGLDLFKECYFCEKKGFKPAVQSVITEMENKLAAQTGSEGTEGGEGGEGRQGTEQPKFVNEIVHGVLSENTKKNKFLQNADIQIVQPASMEQNP